MPSVRDSWDALKDLHPLVAGPLTGIMTVGAISLVGLGLERLELWGLLAAVSLGAGLGHWGRLAAYGETDPEGP